MTQRRGSRDIALSKAEIMSVFDPPALKIIKLRDRSWILDDMNSRGVTGFDTIPV
jgi:hypothetical protein